MTGKFSNAEAYERYMGRWSARLASAFAAFVSVRPDDRVLDVGCGTGSLIRAVIDITPRSTIVGIDPAESFIEFSVSRFADHPSVTLARGSASALPYAEGSFDQALSLLVFQHLPDPKVAALEMSRVTRAGGTVAACTWDTSAVEMSTFLYEEAHAIDPAAVARADRPHQCNTKGALAALWQAVGLADVEERALHVPMEFSSFDDYWVPMRNGVGPTGAFIASLGPEHRDALRDALRARLLGGGPDRPFTLRAEAWAVRGVR